MKNLLAAALLALGLSLPAAARAAAPDVKLWLTPMAGTGTQNLAAGLGVNASRGDLMLSYRNLEMTNCSLCEFNEKASQHQALVGYKAEGRAGYLALLSGISYEKGRLFKAEGASGFDPDDRFRNYGGFGLPLVLDTHLTSRYIGLGVTFFANMHVDHPTGGALVTLPLGLIRSPHGPSAR